MMRREALVSLIALLAASPASLLVAAPPAWADAAPPGVAACESHDPATAVKGCGDILDAGQDMEALAFEAYNNRALAELPLHQPEAALADAQAGIALNPENGGIHVTLARAYMALHQPQAALEAVSQAIALIPND